MRLAILLALGLFGCESTPPSMADSARDGALASDATDDDATDSDAINGDATNGDAIEEARVVPRVPYSARAAGLCQGAPADLSGLTVWVDDATLHAAPHESASASEPLWSVRFAEGEVPSSPVVVGAEVPTDAPTVAVSVRGADACRLLLFAVDGSPRGELRREASSCASPQPSAPLLVWPLAEDREGAPAGRVVWVDSRDAREVASLSLDAAPLTPLVILGTDVVSGGGSHWLVGTTRGLALIAAGANLDADHPPRVVAQLDVSDGTLTSLVVSGELAVATLADPTAITQEVTLGARLAVFRVAASPGGEPSITRVGELDARSPLSAHPVVFDCRDVLDQPVMCPAGVEATLVAGGAGWLGGWHLPSGAPAFEHETALTWSGLALGRGGWVAGGGSHWMPSGEPEWQVVAVRPGPDFATVEVASERGEACVPSPLWDTNGDLVVPVGSGAGRLVRGVLSGIDGRLGLAAGSPRPLGDDQNASSASRRTDRCFDGVTRALSAMPIDDEDLYALAPMSRGVMAYGRASGGGVVHWLPDEGARVSLVLDDMVAVERALPLGDDAVVIAHFDVPSTGSASLSAYRSNGARLWSHPFAADPGQILGLVNGFEDEYLVATRGGSLTLVTRIDAVTGVVEARAFFAPDDPIGLERMVSDGQGGAVLVFDDDRLTVRGVDGSLGLGAVGTWTPPSGQAHVIDATADGAGWVRVLVEAMDARGPLGIWLVRFDPQLAFIDARPAPIAGYFATLADGDSLIQTEQGLARLSAEGAFGLVRPQGGALMADLHAGLHTIMADGDGFRVAFWRSVPSGRELVWGRVDRLGFLACAEAGLCAGLPFTACDSLERCVVSGCLPATGRCDVAPADPSCPAAP